ncbi:unnamed protein product [Calypogeia fissa]
MIMSRHQTVHDDDFEALLSEEEIPPANSGFVSCRPPISTGPVDASFKAIDTIVKEQVTFAGLFSANRN